MADHFVSVNGVRATSLVLLVSQFGPWCIDAVLDDDKSMSGRVVTSIGEHELSGTISPNSGTFGLKRSLRIVAGANGWGRIVTSKNYHNDAGVKAMNVASDAAREVGEAIGTFAPSAERVGRDYLRHSGPASGALASVIGSALWWVDHDGVTHVGSRPTVEAKSADYEVLGHDPRTQMVTLAVDDPLAIGIGSVLSERLDAPQTVREFELTITKDSMRVKAWCGGDAASKGSLTSVMERIVESIVGPLVLKRVFGKWRYRVVQMAGDRVHLQIVRKATGLPDALHVSMMAGLAGGHAQLPGGAVVFVEFIEGDRGQPMITGFPGKEGEGFDPTRLDFFNGTKEVARNGDPVESLLPPAMFQGTIAVGGVPSPATGVVIWSPNKILGTIKGGSSKMKVGG